MPRWATLDDIIKELRKAKKTSRWPRHGVAQAGVVVSKAGALMQTMLSIKYKAGGSKTTKAEKLQEARRAAIETAAVCMRFLEQLP